jgi:hypothetical protein
VTSALLAAAQTRDMATNTGGVKWRPAREVKKKLLTAEQIVDRMRVSYSALRAAKVDAGLRHLFLAELMTQAVNDKSEVVIPEGTAIKMVSKDTFRKYREALSGLTDENLSEVTAKLVQLGLSGGEVSQPPPSYHWPGPPGPSGNTGSGGGATGQGPAPPGVWPIAQGGT